VSAEHGEEQRPGVVVLAQREPVVRVVLGDADPLAGHAVAALLSAEDNVAVIGCESGALGLTRAVEQCSPSVVVVDAGQRPFTGAGLLAHWVASCPNVVVLTTGLSASEVLGLLRSGARGVIDKSGCVAAGGGGARGVGGAGVCGTDDVHAHRRALACGGNGAHRATGGGGAARAGGHRSAGWAADRAGACRAGGGGGGIYQRGGGAGAGSVDKHAARPPALGDRQVAGERPHPGGGVGVPVQACARYRVRRWLPCTPTRGNPRPTARVHHPHEFVWVADRQPHEFVWWISEKHTNSWAR